MAKIWTHNEIGLLKSRQYSLKELSRILGRSYEAVKTKSSRLGLKFGNRIHDVNEDFFKT